MNPINRDELFQQVSQFLKAKGIELQEGSYARTIQKGCQVLADTINLSQQAMDRTKATVGQKLDEVREVIHQKTAPKPPKAPATPPPVTSEPSSKAAKESPKRPRRTPSARSTKAPRKNGKPGTKRA